MLHVKKKSNDNNNSPNHHAVTSGETGTSAASGAGDTDRCGTADYSRKNVFLRIVPVVVKEKDQHNTTVTNALLDHGAGFSKGPQSNF